ncbi:hypothetical protein DL771_002328 [Monosporascus sp. 5C6A]|nr:hypothetical protein DL771_002328 [Monosporascus sp. 5C6A]
MLGYDIVWSNWIQVIVLLTILSVSAKVGYNLFLHPLAKVPGPFWARATAIPSWYHASRGRRHVWLWQLFQIYGSTVRPAPNLVVFCDPQADKAIYGNKSNVQRSEFYAALKRKDNENMPLNIVDRDQHAARRKLLNQAFTEKSLRAASMFVIRHVDRFNELILSEHGGEKDWTASIDLGKKFDGLVFDILGDLCFGKSFGLQEPGDNPMKVIPHTIAEYMRFYYPLCRSPLLSLINWLKPRGLYEVLDYIAPPLVHEYNKFVHDTTTCRIALQKEQAQKSEEERRQDMFYFLYEAHVALPTYNENDLRADSSLLIIAGSDTTAVTLSGLFFYLTGDARRCQKLADEILTTFESAEDIVYGPKLSGCTYLRACIDEAMRLTPAVPCELQREVLAGGIDIMGHFYPAGTIVGTVPWATGRNEDVYGDPSVFRPERWIADGETVTSEEVARQRANFHPFLTGPGACAGKNVALMEMMITAARTLHRFELRRAPGSTLGGGNEDLGWGGRDAKQYQLEDAYIALHQGPEVQFRKRQYSTMAR